MGSQGKRASLRLEHAKAVASPIWQGDPLSDRGGADRKTAGAKRESPEDRPRHSEDRAIAASDGVQSAASHARKVATYCRVCWIPRTSVRSSVISDLFRVLDAMGAVVRVM